MKKILFALACTAALGAVGAAAAQTPPPPAVLAATFPQAMTKGKLMVSSPDMPDGQVPLANSGWGGGVSPALSWSKGPAGTKSYALLMEDSDASRGGGVPIQHWLAANIPGTSLPAGAGTSTDIVQGKNVAGKNGYQGPHPPVGAPAHHYHFQVFALDTVLPLMPGWERDAALDAMKGHVLAEGEFVALAAAPPGAK